MKRVQLNFQEMVSAVLAHTGAHPGAWRGIEPVAQSLAELDATVAEVQKAALKQSEGTGSHTLAKADKLLHAFELTQTYSQRIASFAHRAGDPAQGMVPVRVYELEKMPEAEALRRCQSVLEMGRVHLAGMAPYKVTAESLNELEAALRNAADVKRTAQDQHVDVTAQAARLQEVEARQRRILEVLDMEIESMVDDEAFIDMYFIARRINDRRGRRKKAVEGA